jgi:hypothetical protein
MSLKHLSGKFLLFFFLISTLVILSMQYDTPVYAEVLGKQQLNDLGFTTIYPILEKTAVGGDIVSIIAKNIDNLTLTKIPYDTNMFGVIVDNPSMLMRSPTGTGSAVMRNGEAFVNVTTLGGSITIGDFITSSTLPGKGQKANDFTQGYVLGVAISTFDGANGSAVSINGKEYKSGQIKVAIGVGPASPVQIKASGGVLGTIQFMFASLAYNIQTSRNLEKIIRYIIAAIVAILTIYINFRTFGKNITKGIESIGRNPLAKVSIQGMIILNSIMIGVISIAGIILALVIISL